MARRLAAILAADVVGYSRLMETDEAGTLDALKAHRSEFIDPLIAERSGRVVKLMGDGALVEFGSVVDAVACAVALQLGMADRNAAVPAHKQIVLRIGVNLGDVIVEGDDIYGDGVNVAARLEALATPGGICLSGTVHENIVGKLDHEFVDKGEQTVKNISRPVRVWRWSEAASSQNEEVRTSSPSSRPSRDRPSVAVLPFQNLSSDPEQEYFADGLTEDIITELSRFRSVFVSARNSSFHYKGTSPKVEDVGRELGVAYVVEGSVRRSGNRIRVTAQLIETEGSNHVWAERYDRDLEDIFAVQDELTRTVVSTIAGRIEVVAHARASRMTPDRLQAYDLVLRARRQVYQLTKPDNHQAQRFLAKAIALDPTSARAHAAFCSSHVLDYISHWAKEGDASLDEALDLARRAVTLDETDCYAQWNLGMAHLFSRQYDRAKFHLGRALELNPNDVEALALNGLYLTFIGFPEEAFDQYALAQQVDPHHISWLPWYQGFTGLTAKRFDDAIMWLESFEEPPIEVRGILAASYAHANRVEEAHGAAEDFLRTAKEEMIDFPGRSAMSWIRNWHSLRPYKNEADLDVWYEGLRKAGLDP